MESVKRFVRAGYLSAALDALFCKVCMCDRWEITGQTTVGDSTSNPDIREAYADDATAFHLRCKGCDTPARLYIGGTKDGQFAMTLHSPYSG